MTDSGTPGAASAETYDICLLLEQALSREDPVHYHVLMPLEDAAAHIEAALGTLAAGDAMAATPLSVLEEDAERAREEAVELSDRNCAACVATLGEMGAESDAEVIVGDPVDRLAQAVRERGSREVIILTRAHLVADLFHTDWAHQARRKLGVPVLHLLAHRDAG